MVAGGKFGVPVVSGSSTPSVAVADLGVPVSVYCPSVTLTVVVSVFEAVVADVMVEALGEPEGESEGCDELPITAEDEGEPVEVSFPELMTDGDVAGVDVDETVEEVGLEEDDEELLAGEEAPAPVTLTCSASSHLIF